MALLILLAFGLAWLVSRLVTPAMGWIWRVVAAWINLTIVWLNVFLPYGEKISDYILFGIDWLLLPTLLVAGFGWANAVEQHPRRGRANLLVLATIALVPVTWLTSWPLCLSFWLCSPTLNRLADQVEAGKPIGPDEWAGVYHVRAGRLVDDSFDSSTILILSSSSDADQGLIRRPVPGFPDQRREAFPRGRWSLYSSPGFWQK